MNFIDIRLMAINNKQIARFLNGFILYESVEITLELTLSLNILIILWKLKPNDIYIYVCVCIQWVLICKSVLTDSMSLITVG